MSNLGIDSPLRGWAMPKSYSGDLRERVIEAVEMGASRREAADRFEISVSSAVRWLQCWQESRSSEPKPRGGSVSPLEEFAAQVLGLIAERPDQVLWICGQRAQKIVDATIVSAPKQHNRREENEAIKAGKTPEGWEEKPAKNAQKDKDARWTKKNEQNFYGYKNHISIDRKHKIIRRYAETDATVHDSQKLDEVLDKSNTSNEVWADSAYRSVEIEARLKAKGYKSRIHRRGARNHPLSKRQQAANTTRSRARARVEHVFGDQENAMGGKFVRTIGIVRARVKIGMMNLVYNMRRLVQLERMAIAPA